MNQQHTSNPFHLSHSAPTKVSVGNRRFDLIGFDRPAGYGHGLDDSAPAAALAAFERQSTDGLHLYSSEAGARLFERMMDEFEDELSAPRSEPGAALVTQNGRSPKALGARVSHQPIGRARCLYGAGCPDRTDDLPLTRRVLYQLS